MTTDKTTGNKSTFDVEREELHQWPYAIHAIDEALDADLIEGRGKQLLFQALNQKNAVAFVGSGVSQAFGRLSWSDWSDRQLALVKTLAKGFLACVDKSEALMKAVQAVLVALQPETAPRKVLRKEDAELLGRYFAIKQRELRFRGEEVRALSVTLDALSQRAPSGLGDEQPVIFQVAEQLQKVLSVNQVLFVDPGMPSQRGAVETGQAEVVCWARFGFVEDAQVSPAPATLLTRLASELGLRNETVVAILGDLALRTQSEKSDLSKDQMEFWRAWFEYRDALVAFERQTRIPEARLPLADMAKTLLVDEVAHAESILWRSVEFSSDAGRQPWAEVKARWTEDHKPLRRINDRMRHEGAAASLDSLRRDVPGIRQAPDRYWSLGYFKTEVWLKLLNVLESTATDLAAWTEMRATLRKALETNKASATAATRGVARWFVSPTHRFVFEMLLAIVEDPLVLLQELEKVAGGDIAVKKEDFKARTSIIDPEVDPIETIVMRLGISRFLTTNYDFELERFYQDRGYRVLPSEGDARAGANGAVRQRDHDTHRIDDIGGVFKDQAFRRDRASELVNFAIDFEGADAHVFHLHGSAALNEKTVITENDYMQLYLRQDRYRDTVNEAIRVAFSANPLVFFGLGMKEPDVLRPLRQFMSDRDRTVSRTAIVVYPATADADARKKFSAMLYLRYGVHTVHYGRGYLDLKPKLTGSRLAVDWLHFVDRLIDGLEIISKRQRSRLLLALRLGTPNRAGKVRKVGLDDAEAVAKQAKGLSHELLQPDSGQQRMIELCAHVGKFKLGNKEYSGLAALTGRAIGTAKAATKLFAKVGTLQVPDFPAGTRDPDSSAAPASVSGKIFVGDECAMLSALYSSTIAHDVDAKKLASYVISQCIAGTRVRLTKSDRDKLRADVRTVNARLVGLKGLREAIITGTLCGSLKAIEQEWQSWWRHWQMSPPNRAPLLEKLPSADAPAKPARDSGVPSEPAQTVFVPLRYIRHRVDSVINDLSSLETGAVLRGTRMLRSSSGAKHRAAAHPTPSIHPNDTDVLRVTGVRTFDSFLEAIELGFDRAMKAHPKDTGRRWTSLMGHRGVGRGTFLSAFQSRRGLAQYIESSWPRPSSSPPVYVAAIYINLAFATEIASCFDLLVDALIEVQSVIDQVWHDKTSDVVAVDADDRQRVEASIHARLAELHDAICTPGDALGEPLQERQDEIRRRLSGLPRQTKIEALFEDIAAKARPRYGWALHPRFLLCISGIDLLHHPGGMPKNREIRDLLNFLASEEVQDVPFDLCTVTSETNPGEIFLRERTPFLGRYSEALGSTVAEAHRPQGKLAQLVHVRRANLSKRAQQSIKRRVEASQLVLEEQAVLPPSRSCLVHMGRVVSPEQLLVDNFLPLAVMLLFNHLRVMIEKSNVERLDGLDPKHVLEEVKATGIDQFRLDNSEGNLAEAWGSGSIKECLDNNREIRGNRHARVLAALVRVVGNSAGDDASASVALIQRYQTDMSSQREWSDIRNVLGSNRYCLTILMAAAQRIALSAPTIDVGAALAERFIRKVIDHVRAVSSTEREEAVLSDVLDAYEAFHHAGRPNDDMVLHLLILRHLAVIGAPCSADVLVRTPDLLRYFDGMPEEQERSRLKRLVQALTSLTERGLLFRLHPNPWLKRRFATALDTEKYPGLKEREFGEVVPGHEYRYALHRLTQRHIIRKMGSGPREFMEINNYAPTLYASMPADLPRLSHEAHRFLRKLVDSLSQYPDRKGSDAESASWHFGEAPLSTRVQALRAALSIVRSSFSVGVVSRFEDYESHDPDGNVPARGHFEAYRVQVRWLIRKSWELMVSKPDPLKYDPDNPAGGAVANDHLNAFYRDEIVWLYNECGVVCLVQGNILDAGALLRQAMRFNRAIEGTAEGSPQHNRLSVNLAISQIERGRLGPAAKRLQDICDSEERRRRGRVWHIAHGYLGVISHFQGRYEEAEERYRTAIRVLQAYDDWRSCSIFARYYCNLERHLAKLQHSAERWSHAERLVGDSIGYAQSGGHEDLHKRARLTRVQVEISRQAGGPVAMESVLGQLRLIEEYAETMEMPSLVVDVLIVRARLLLAQGESSLAGALLARVMAITKRSGMNRRLNAAAITYARVLAKRDMKDQANQMLFGCLDVAKRSGNQMQIAQVEEAFDEMHRRP